MCAPSDSFEKSIQSNGILSLYRYQQENDNNNNNKKYFDPGNQQWECWLEICYFPSQVLFVYRFLCFLFTCETRLCIILHSIDFGKYDISILFIVVWVLFLYIFVFPFFRFIPRLNGMNMIRCFVFTKCISLCRRV